VAAALPIAGNWSRRHAEGHCALDGIKIDPLFRTRIVDARGKSHEFCCIRCAEWWLGHQTIKPRAIYVVDETSGEEISAASAFFVRSLVETNAATANRIHVFCNKANAEKHANLFKGTLLESERPFAAALPE
jgi:hypothetical protein